MSVVMSTRAVAIYRATHLELVFCLETPYCMRHVCRRRRRIAFCRWAEYVQLEGTWQFAHENDFSKTEPNTIVWDTHSLSSAVITTSSSSLSCKKNAAPPTALSSPNQSMAMYIAIRFPWRISWTVQDGSKDIRSRRWFSPRRRLLCGI